MKTLSKLLSFKKLNWVDRIFIGCLLLFTFALASFRPVPILPESECQVLSGTVTDVYESGTTDVTFKLEGQRKEFYINRGIERGLNIKQLQATLAGKEVTIKYPEYWSLINFNKRVVHVSKLEAGGKVIFSELSL